MAKIKKSDGDIFNIGYRRTKDEVKEYTKYLKMGQSLSSFEKEMADAGFAYKLLNKDTSKGIDKKFIDNQEKRHTELLNIISSYATEVSELKGMIISLSQNQGNMIKVFVNEAVKEINKSENQVQAAAGGISQNEVNALLSQNSDLLESMKAVLEKISANPKGTASAIQDDRLNKFITAIKLLTLNVIMADENLKNNMNKEVIDLLKNL